MTWGLNYLWFITSVNSPNTLASIIANIFNSENGHIIPLPTRAILIKTEKKSWLMKPWHRRCDSPAIQLLSYAVTMRIASNLQPVARGDSGRTDEPAPPPHTHARWSPCECCHFFVLAHTWACVHTGACNICRQVSQDHWWGQYGNSCVSLQHFLST